MSNPAVIKLTSTKVCGREVKIEDNLGESIHIHLGEMRIDLTIQEFQELSDKAEYILDQMDSLIPTQTVSWRDFNPIFLQNPKNMDLLFRLNNVYITKIKLKDILVDSYIKLPFIGKIPMYRSVKYSRIVKALNGSRKDNDSYYQLNELFVSNNERIKENLESIKSNGYPFNKEYIILNSENMIIDGQHRAAGMFYLHGPEYEIPVMKWEFPDPLHIYFPHKKRMLEIVFRAYLALIYRQLWSIIKLPLLIKRIIKGNRFKLVEKTTKNIVKREPSLKNRVTTLETLINIIKNKNINFIVVDNGFAQSSVNVILSMLVEKESFLPLKECMQENGFWEQDAFSKDTKYLYSLEKDVIYSNGVINIHVYNQLFCKSMFENAMVPLEQFINKEAWRTKEYNEKLKCFQIGLGMSVILLIVQSVFLNNAFL